MNRWTMNLSQMFSVCRILRDRFFGYQQRQIRWFLLLIVSGFLLTNLAIPAVYGSKPAEIRGVWLTNIDSEVLFEPGKLKNSIEKLAKLNFNTLYPTVWNWGYTLYPSQVAEAVTGTSLDPTPGLQERDILQEIIQLGSEKGLAVIPWFEFGFMAPADSVIAKEHPDWLVQRQDGSSIWLEGNVHQRVWLNPLHPEVQQFISDLVLEIVGNYEVKGIQFDDHFGYPSEFGYDPLTVERYRQEHGGKTPPSDVKDPDWIQWRADKITGYLQTLRQQIREKNPQAIVSISPNPQKFSLQAFLADWFRWQQLGLIDELVVQLYRDNDTAFLRELSQPELRIAKRRIPVAIGIIAGLKNKPIPITRIQKQVKQVRDRKFSGVSFFFYESLWAMGPESLDKRQAEYKKLFAQQALRSE